MQVKIKENRKKFQYKKILTLFSGVGKSYRASEKIQEN